MKVLHLPDEIVFVERPVRVDEISCELLHRFFVENLDRILVKNIDRFPKIFSRFFVKVDRVRNDVVVFWRKWNADARVVRNKV